jgi:uncharacterized MFS-type transporter YbfB
VRAPLPAAIRGGLVVMGAATVAMGLESRFAVWIGLRALAGAATGWVLPLAPAWALERLAPRPPALRATVFAGYGVGIAAAGGVCLALMQAATRSRTAWLIMGGLSLTLTAVAWRRFADDGGRAPVSHAASGFQEGRRVGGPHATRMIAAMASAFAIGQIVGPIAVSATLGGDGTFSRPLGAAGVSSAPVRGR